ncbi:MAG TPA: hypothetical protein VNX28_03280 [Gemmataceae bacterium]|jgi:hypothetical protein|nr:hypothetical protein [Gemmataceae bacterium]
MKSLTVLSVIFVTSLACAQDVASGPDKGKKVPPLKVFDATGPNQGKEVDYTAERKEMPTVYVFVQADKWTRPIARFLVKLDEAVLKEGRDASVIAVWLTDGPDKTKKYLPLAQQSLKFQTTALTCYTGDKSGPERWGINGDAHLTVVVTNEKKVAAVFGYISTNETAVPQVQKALQETIDKK